MAEGGAKKRNEICNSSHVIQLFIVQPIELASGIVNALIWFSPSYSIRSEQVYEINSNRVIYSRKYGS